MCIVIVGKRARDGGQPCGHPRDRHVGTYSSTLCLDCAHPRTDITTGVSGCDHQFLDTAPTR
tara:strand:+ start:163 stop:348 length:186 start_codon:yes stop_codon:yes gene_type:complete